LALARDRKAVWTGVRNALARKRLRAIKKGDRIVHYRAGNEKAVVGNVKAQSDPYPMRCGGSATKARQRSW
jgi:predicted RNA-binding protein with PUA-like domain